MGLYPSSNLEDHPDGLGDLNAIHNSNWQVLNNWISAAFGLTATLNDESAGAGNIVNASAGIFDDADGATIFFLTDRLNYTITSHTSATRAIVGGTPANLASQPFLLFRSSETEYTALARGLLKLTRLGASEDKKVPRWSNSLQRMVLENFPGYAATSGQVLFGGGAGNDMSSSADLVFDDSINLLTVGGNVLANSFRYSHATIASAASIAIDFNTNELSSINTLAHDVTFAASQNIAAGRKKIVRIVCDGTPRTLAFPAWVWLNTSAPASIAAGKTGLLTLVAFGTADTDVVARWEVEL